MAKNSTKAVPCASHRFKVYPEKDRYFYYDVMIFNRRQEMLDYYDAVHRDEGDSTANNFHAICVRWFSWQVDADLADKLTADDADESLVPDGKPSRKVGEILFYRSQTGTGTVSHEAYHAAQHLATYYKWDAAKIEDEEKIAYALQRIVKTFFSRY